MRLSFRQGIVRYERHQAPPILSRTSMTASSIDLNVIDSPIVVTFAHYGANYVIEETRSIVGAWGSGDPNSTNGPLLQNQTQYLYWDLNLATGALTRGWTSVPWVYAASEPLDPPHDLHWFDLNTNRMRVWRRPGAAPGYWQDVVRCFAGWYDSNAIINIYEPGSQVGINGEFEGGNLIFGSNNVPLKQSDGTFATTATQFIIQQTSGHNVKFDAAVIFCKAAEEIPAFYLVSFLPDKKVQLARSYDIYSYAHGMVIESLAEGETGQIVTNGLIRNDQWNFPRERIGSPLFLGPTGEIWFTPSSYGLCQRVGEVYDVNAINLNLHQPIRLNRELKLG